MNLPAILSILGFVCYGVLIYTILPYSVRARGRVGQLFLLNLMVMICWQGSALVVSLARSESLALVGYQAMSVIVMAFGVLYAIFVRAFLGLKVRNKVVTGSSVLWVVTLVLLIVARSWIIKDVYWNTRTHFYLPVFGTLAPIVGVPYYALLGYVVALLLRGYRQAQAPLIRTRLQYLLLGWTIIVLGTLANFVPSLNTYPLDLMANIINAFLIAYAILRYQLLDITIVIRKGLLYSIPTAAIAVSYFLIIFAVERVFRAFRGYHILLSILVAAITAVAIQPLRDKAQLWIDRLFFREKYDAQLMLQEVSKVATYILDIERLGAFLLDRIMTTMHVKRACIMLKEKGDDQFHLIVQKGQAGLRDEMIFREDHPVVRWLTKYKQPLTRHDLDVLPQFKALWAQEREDLSRIEAELFIPLLVRGELVGILILGPKLSEAPYSPDEQLTLTTLANQTAVAIQNAWLYSDLEHSLEELKQMQAQLIQAEKLSATGEMIAGIAHEINNPLTAVIGYSQLLQSMDLDPQLKRDIGQILKAGLRVKRIVAHLLDFSRQHKPQKEYVDINQIVSHSLELCAHDLMVSNILVETDLAPDLPRTMADPHQLQQVFINIINNAQQAMEEKDGPRMLTIRTQQSENHTILISFKDTGPGIPKEIMGRIFDPFFTTKEVGQGTGLGLSVSYGIVQEHGGRIWAESEEGQGAAFFVELPIYPEDQFTRREEEYIATAAAI